MAFEQVTRLNEFISSSCVTSVDPLLLYVTLMLSSGIVCYNNIIMSNINIYYCFNLYKRNNSPKHSAILFKVVIIVQIKHLILKIATLHNILIT